MARPNQFLGVWAKWQKKDMGAGTIKITKYKFSTKIGIAEYFLTCFRVPSDCCFEYKSLHSLGSF